MYATQLTEYVYISKYEIILMALTIIIVMLVFFAYFIHCYEAHEKKKAYMQSLNDKDFRKYAEFKESL